MPETIVFISHFKIKEGKFESLIQNSQRVTEQIKENKPGTVVFMQYTNNEKTELSIIHVFPDAEAFDRQMEGAEERSKAAIEFIEPTRREVYGAPSDKVMEALRPLSNSGIVFHAMPKATGGYIRIDS